MKIYRTKFIMTCRFFLSLLLSVSVLGCQERKVSEKSIEQKNPEIAGEVSSLGNLASFGPFYSVRIIALRDLTQMLQIGGKEPYEAVGILKSINAKTAMVGESIYSVIYVSAPCGSIKKDDVGGYVSYGVFGETGRKYLRSERTGMKVQKGTFIKATKHHCSFIASNIFPIKFSEGLPFGKYQIRANVEFEPSSVVSTSIKLPVVSEIELVER